MAFFLELDFKSKYLLMEDAEAYFEKNRSSCNEGNTLVNLPSITDRDDYVLETTACVVYLLEKAGRQDMMNTTWQREQAASIVTSFF
jgi:hypothetical protein